MVTKTKISKNDAVKMVAKAIATLYKHKYDIVPKVAVGEDVFKRFLNRCLLWDATELKIDQDESFHRIRYVGIDYWSEKAIKHWKRYKKGNGMLIHEHMIPKKVLLAKIDENPKDAEHVQSILKKYAIAVVVHKSDDKKLSKAQKKLEKKNPKWYDDDKTGRYKEAGIEIYATGGVAPSSSSCKPKRIKLSNL
ncbi:MAG TPA: hypothetical protein VFD13_00530 [Candidatus Kapabacteria bacterium]|nr:hypothetical protein [Candidatus Kapabacteria bacterium]